MTATDTINGHIAVSGIVARVGFEEQVLFHSELDIACPSSVFQHTPHLLIHRINLAVTKVHSRKTLEEKVKAGKQKQAVTLNNDRPHK